MLEFPIYLVLVNQEATSSPENSNTLLGSQLPSQDGQLEPLNEGFLSRISDLLLCRWTCRHCCQKCYESSCCQSSEDEVEILGPFPAQTPPWLMASRSSDKDGDSVHTASEVPLTPRTNSPDGRRSSSDTSKSTYSLTRRISSLESRRPSSPLIDIKPIEFGVLSSKKEPIQPSVLRRTYTPDDYFRKFEPHLYSLDSNSDDVDSLTDEEILTKYQLGMLHFSTQYDLLHNHLTVRVIEARDLPPPISHDGSRQDMAHSNPYVKICLLPDQKNSKQTGVKRKTQKPVFEERYTFEIPFLEAQRRTLLLTVVDFDKFSRHCVIGKVSVPLCEVDLVKGGHWWKALIPSSQNEVELGELLLSLNYLPSAGRLNVDVIRAKQLLQTDVSQGSDPFVKIQLVHGLKLVKTKKTSFLRGTIDPFYNESFSFKVPQEELENASLVFTVFGHNMKSSNDFIGRIVIGQYSSGPSESNHWRRMLNTHRTAVEQWHSLRSRAECDRVSPASLEVT
ncbi:synaptotagmin-17 isoform X1 [Cebus imitator]|uniref:Synaptotagmin-17 n=3 Tax=Cebinae TaxID=38070 RepID=A0A2K5RNW5_CEBIM|nr:synaptotagmin-17 isoform X1 [Cebus imitator]XP_032098709.1 synaptotagmin-17 isoform X1 [Sapajus apella]